MRYLIVADIHANLEALTAVLQDAPGHDAVICLGDTVGYGASPNECVECVRSLPGLVSLVGNHDLAALGKLDLGLFNDYAREAALWTGRTLTQDSRRFLDALEPAISADEWYLAHASPRDPVWEYMEDAFQGPPNFELFDQRLCMVGHTHVPRVFLQQQDTEGVDVMIPRSTEILAVRDSLRYIVNPGGVGQPRDRDPRAAYGLMDSVALTFEIRRVQYDIESSQKKIEAAGLPRALALRLALGV